MDQTPSSDHATGPSHLRWLVPALLLIAAFACYLTAIRGEFVFDDYPQVTESWAVNTLAHGKWLGGLQPRMLTIGTLTLNYVWTGRDTWSFHLVNILIHAAASITLFALLRRLLELPRWSHAVRRHAIWLAAAVALIWAVHPLNSQAVAYISQRAEALMGLFYLLVLLCLLRGSTASTDRGAGGWYLAAVAACVAGLASKEVAVTAPVAAFLFGRLFLRDNWRDWRRGDLVYLALFASLTYLRFAKIDITLGVTPTQAQVVNAPIPQAAADLLKSEVGTNADRTVGLNLQDVTPKTYLYTQSQVLLHYVRLAFWPDALVIDYDWPIAKSFSQVWWQFLLLAGALATSIWLYVRRNWIGFAGLWFFITLGPTSSIVPLQDAAFEHRMYLALISLVALATAGGYRLLHRRTLAAAAVAGVVVLALGIRTAVRASDYQSQVAIWESATRVRPQSARAWLNYGAAVYESNPNLSEKDRVGRVIGYYQRAHQLRPDQIRPLLNLGTSHLLLEEYDQAEAYYREVLRRQTRNVDAAFRMGVIARRRADDAHSPQTKQQYTQTAIEWFERATTLRATHTDAMVLLAVLYDQQGRRDEAIRLLERVKRINPDYASAWMNLGLIYRDMGDAARAESEMRQAVELDPLNGDFHAKLGHLLATQKRIAQAREHFIRAIELEPASPWHWTNLGAAENALGRYAAAANAYEEALDRDPGDLALFDRAARAYLAANDPRPPVQARMVELAHLGVERSQGRSLRHIETYARVLGHTGRVAQALQLLDQSQTLLDQLPPGDPLRRRIEQLHQQLQNAR